MRTRIAFVLASLLISLAVGSQNKIRPPISINSRLELFVDSFLIDSLDNLQLRMQVPVDNGPVLWFDKPWEGPFSAYSTIIRDKNIYRLYYRGLTSTQGEATNEEVTCYAESTDGIHWVKPELKLFKIMDSWDNNIVMANAKPASHNFSPFLDSNSSNHSTGKFKALGGLTEGLVAFISDDGIHWKKLQDKPVLTGEPFDSQNTSFWSENEKCYVCYFRKWINHDGKLIRSVGRSTSVDFVNWSDPVAMDFGNSIPEELYTNQTSPYYRAPHIYIATAARFFPGKQVISADQASRLNVNPNYYKDCSDAVLITSRGGTSYQRTFMEGFLKPGIGLNNWISRTNYPALNVVRTGENEMSFYVNQDYAQPSAHLHRYSLRIDGFASLHAGYKPGIMTTKLLTFSGSQLLINFSTSAAGYVIVEILDNMGKVIPGFSSGNCIPMTGNEISREVEWKSLSKLENINETPVKIRFIMKDADLYSMQFNYPVQTNNQNIWSVRKEMYSPSPEPRAGISLSMNYIGSGLKREEIRAVIKSSDWVEKPKKRTSNDNGHTWSDWTIIDEQSKVQGDYTLSGGESQDGTGPYDPVSRRLIKPVFQRIIKGKPEVAMSEIWKGIRLFSDHGFYQLSEDDGLTWDKACMLKYEEGPDFNDNNWGDEKFFRTNEMYIGNALSLKNGSVIITATVPVPFMDEEDKNMPSIFPNNYREGCVGGAVCFIGRWNESKKNYDWKLSMPLFVPRRVSTRGLDELHISELKNGKLLMIIRGSNTGLDPVKYPGRRWYSVSEDGGLNWSEIKDMRYESGENFYSPASISSTIRSSVNGKLYWIGNISEHPVDGNSPRYPLVIIEVDEERLCFIKNTMTIIDDRNAEHDSPALQLSNFSVFENRETYEIEIYLLRLGEHGDGADIWTADSYKYTLCLKTD